MIIYSLDSISIQSLINIIYDTIPLVLSTIIGTYIVRRAFVPKVNIKTKKEHILTDAGGHFLSLNIINTGLNMAQHCCCYLVLETKILDNDLLNNNDAALDEHLPRYTNESLLLEQLRSSLITKDKIRDVQQVQLCWTHHGNPYYRDLNPGVTAQIDICRFQRFENNNGYYIIFPTESGWRRIHFRAKYKEMKGILYICPANSFPNIFSISFQLDDNSYPYINIKKVNLNSFSRKRFLLK